MTNQDKMNYMRQKIKQSKRGNRLSEQEARLIGKYSYEVMQEIDGRSEEAEEILGLLLSI